MKNGFIYARFSSHGQNEQTIEGQVRICSEYAKAHGINIINIYREKARTGTDVNRPVFQKMIADCENGGIDCIIVYMLDRFARSQYYSVLYRHDLEKLGISIVSATQNVTDDESGEFYRMFLEWNDEKYSTRLSKRVKEGLTTSVLNGTFAGGHLIYGYKKEKADTENAKSVKVVIDDAAAADVQYVFNEYVNGTPKIQIAEQLNAKGSRLNGKPWKAKNFDRMLCNPKYTGVYEFGGRICAKTYPQIIDPVLFDKAQKRAQENKYFSGANSAREKYLLQGKVYCGHCGANMVADGGTSKTGVQHHYYACTGKKRAHNCNKSNERKEPLEKWVVMQVVEYLSNPQRVSFIADDVVKYYESRTDTSELKRLANEKVKTQKEIDNAVNLMISGVSSDVVKTLDKKIVELTALLNDLSNEYNKLEFEQGLRITKKDIIEFVAEYIQGNPNDKDFQKRIIDNLVNVVYVYDDKVVLFFNIKCGRETEFVSKNEIDSALPDLGVKVQTLPRTLRQVRQCLNTNNILYIFVKGVAGIVIKKDER